MSRFRLRRTPLHVAGLLVLALAACGRRAPSGDTPDPLGTASERVLQGVPDAPALADAERAPFRRLAGAAQAAGLEGSLTVDYPADGTVYPPDLVPPRFRWHDASPGVDAWLVEARFDDGTKVRALVAGPPPPRGEIDESALGRTNEIYVPTPYQQSARTWEPSAAVWDVVRRHAVDAPVDIRFVGYRRDDPATPLSTGGVRLTISSDPVDAPIFYRDVPLMPSPAIEGVVSPLAPNALPLIRWRLRDLDAPESHVVLREMPTCANCHSFSLDGKTMGMDIDGPEGDKGAYMLAPVEKEMVVEDDDVFTWNSYAKRTGGRKTIGFLSRVSPDGGVVLSTVNEEVYVANFEDYRIPQVFFPTRGILAWYSAGTGEIRPLPGADDPAFVHTNGVWSPDGKWIVFSRAPAKDAYTPGQELATQPNDPRETQIQYDLYRIPFNDGEGGVAEPIAGASANGMSNSFPKVSPDGRWIVWTRCRNGQLLRPDGRLWIVPFEGGEPREMRCNTALMNSWHSFSPNGRWMVFSSKADTPYTQLFLTHLAPDGTDSPAVRIPNSTAANRAANLPEFLNASPDAILRMEVPAVRHFRDLQEGVELLEAEQPTAALPYFERAAATDPGLSRAHEGLGGAYLKLRQLDKAIQQFELALAIRDEAPMSHVGIAMAYGQLGRMDRALQHLTRAAALSPRLPIARRLLGMTLLNLGKREPAFTQLELAHTLDRSDAIAAWGLVRLCLERGEIGRAQDLLEEILSYDAEDAKAHNLLAWSLATAEDPAHRDGARALTHAQRAVTLTEGREPSMLDALAAAQAELGRYDEAVTTIQRALQALPAQNADLRTGFEKRRRLYQSHQPLRSPR